MDQLELGTAPMGTGSSSWRWHELPKAGCPVGHAQEEMISVPPSPQPGD